MAETRRSEAAPDPDGADRDVRAEALLVEGLDRYFAGRYDDAIHLWTRVLFLDRSHARARAYIDRARTALAERQRHGEEMLEASHDLLAQGRTDAARQLLAEAVATGGEDERAAALRSKLDRLERLDQLSHRPAAPEIARSPAPLPGWRWPRRRPRAALVGGLALATLGLAAIATLLWMGDVVGLPSRRDRLIDRPSPEQWPVLSSAEVALVRARRLYSGGRLAEALQALDQVGSENPARGRADALRVEIQELLLAGGPDRFRPKGDRR
jgi:tetratricopeptide (TPR) repeat protein